MVGVAILIPKPNLPSGRCARCKGNAVLERFHCEDCRGIGTDGDGEACDACGGVGTFDSTSCCGWPLLDESAGVDAAYERRAERSGSGEKACA